MLLLHGEVFGVFVEPEEVVDALVLAELVVGEEVGAVGAFGPVGFFGAGDADVLGFGVGDEGIVVGAAHEDGGFDLGGDGFDVAVEEGEVALAVGVSAVEDVGA